MNRLLFSVLLIALTGCYFKPEGEFFQKVTARDYSTVSINLNTVADTIYVGTPTTFTYSINDNSFQFDHAAVTIGDQQVNGSLGQEGSFVVDPYYFTTGIYSMTVSVTVKTGNGSLADQYSIEKTTVWKSFLVYIDNSIPPGVDVTSIDTTNGTLTLHWKPYTGHGFQYYAIKKGDADFNVTISNSSTTSWSDSSYVGGPVTYQIYLFARQRMGYGQPFHYSYAPRVGFEIINKIAYVHWQPSIFYKNIKEIVLYDGSNQETRTLNDTTWQSSTLYLGISKISVYYSTSSYQNSFLLEIPYYRGKKYPDIFRIPQAYNPKAQLYYCRDILNNGLTINDKNLVFLSGLYSNTFAMSGDGNHVVGYVTYDPPAKLYELDPSNFAMTNPLTVSALSNFSVGNNGLIAYNDATTTKVVSLPGYSPVYSGLRGTAAIAISPSGEYLFDDGKVFHYNGSSFDLLGTVNISNLVAFQFTKNNKLVIGYKDRSLSVISTPSLAVEHTASASVGDEYTMTYDFTSDKLFLRSYGNCVVFDPVSGEVIGLPYLSSESFVNGIIFTSQEFDGVIGLELDQW